MSFVNVYEAEMKERRLMNVIRRVSMLDDTRISQLGMMLSAKRSVNNSLSPTGKIGNVLGKLGLNTRSSSSLSYRINGCLSAIDRTIDNNIIALIGVSLDSVGLLDLLRMSEIMGNDFARLSRALGYIMNYGPSALYQLQDALAMGVENTIMDVVAMASDIATDAINAAAQEAFCALLPSLNGLQNELGGILGGVGDLAEAVTSLTHEITNDINNVLISAQMEFNELSDTIAGGLFGYATNRGSTCAMRPDAQSNLMKVLTQTIC